MGSNHSRASVGVVIALAMVGGHGAARAQSPGADSAKAALRVLERHCAPCHGGPSRGAKASRGGFGHVLNPARLRAEGQIVPGNPDASELYQKVRDGDMPPKLARVRPSADEVAQLRAWLASMAETGPQGPALLTPAQEDATIATDLGAMTAARARRARYVSLSHLARDGATDAELTVARDAVAKLLNSLSWQPRVARLTALGPRATVLRIDLAAIGWSPRTWQRLAVRSPYAAVRRSRDAARARRLTGTHVPVVRGDWLVTEASRPPMYHELARIPTTVAALERALGVDADDDVYGRRVVRAGFSGSGVSRHNRIIQRHPLASGGYLWRSFDFRSSAGRRNIFNHPLEPGLAKRGFQHDGGELIFSLPNGMQAYMLTDARGNRVDAAPVDIVSDPSRPDGVVRNGVSCMGCHVTGIIPKRDAVRSHLVANRLALSRGDLGLAARALALYARQPALAQAMQQDRQRYESALGRAGIALGADPIGWLVRHYEADPGADSVAAELGVDGAVVTALLRANPDLAARLGQLGRGGAVKREVLARAFPVLLARFGLGRPLRAIPQSEKDRLSCRGGGGVRVCGRAARAADRRSDKTRALAFHRAACAAGSAHACHIVGQRFIDGVGTPRDLSRAARALSRSCTLGRAEACVVIGNLYFNGGGVARSGANALAFYRRACQLGAPRGCSNAAIVYETGRGVPAQLSRAAALYEQACRSDVTKSCLKAGAMFYQGSGVPRDRGRAAALFDRACRGGVGSACRRLAVQYRWGVGVSADWIRSERLFRRACRLGVDQACLYL